MVCQWGPLILCDMWLMMKLLLAITIVTTTSLFVPTFFISHKQNHIYFIPQQHNSNIVGTTKKDNKEHHIWKRNIAKESGKKGNNLGHPTQSNNTRPTVIYISITSDIDTLIINYKSCFSFAKPYLGVVRHDASVDSRYKFPLYPNTTVTTSYLYNK